MTGPGNGCHFSRPFARSVRELNVSFGRAGSSTARQPLFLFKIGTVFLYSTCNSHLAGSP